MTREEGLAYARRWREENRAYFDSLYPPAETLQAEAEGDPESAAKLIAMMDRDAWRATVVVGCVTACLVLGLIGLGWALRGWIG